MTTPKVEDVALQKVVESDRGSFRHSGVGGRGVEHQGGNFAIDIPLLDLSEDCLCLDKTSG